MDERGRTERGGRFALVWRGGGSNRRDIFRIVLRVLRVLSTRRDSGVGYCTAARGLSVASRSPPQPRPSELTGPARIQQLIAYLTPAAGALPECSVRSSSCHS